MVRSILWYTIYIMSIIKWLGSLASVIMAPWLVLAVWEEPNCDPSADPSACNVSAPLNVSGADQTKAGSLNIGASLNVGSILTVTGISDLNNTLNVAGVTNLNNSLTVSGTAQFNGSLTASNTFIYNGAASSFFVTNNSIGDAMVQDSPLTASIFRGTGSTSDAVDLETLEVTGTLPSTSVSDVWVNTTGDTMIGGLVLTPTSGVTALAITPTTTNRGIDIFGQTNEPLLRLNPSNSSGSALWIELGSSTTGDAVYLTTTSTSTGDGIDLTLSGSGKGIDITSSSTTSSAYLIMASSNGSVDRTINVTNNATYGQSIYAISSGTNSTGITAFGQLRGVEGTNTTSATGYGVFGSGNGTYATGVYGTGYKGVSGYTSNPAGYGVYGYAQADSSGTSGYGGYFVAEGDTATALYAVNANTVTGLTKYAFQAEAITPSGIAVDARSDYGVAGWFHADAGGRGVVVDVSGGSDAVAITSSAGSPGMSITTTDASGLNITTNSTTADATGIYVNAGGGQEGIDVTASSTGIDIHVADYSDAIDTNGGFIQNLGAYNGGQFYPHEAAGNGIYPNVVPDYIYAIALKGRPEDMLYDGSDIWISESSSETMERLNPVNGRVLATYNMYTASSASSVNIATIELVDDTIYAFDSTDSDYAKIERLNGTVTINNLGSVINIYSSTFDGESIWLGGASRIFEWENLTTLSSRLSGTGTIVDIIYADGYIWAADATNDIVRRLDPTSFSSSSITVGDYPVGLVYDGQFVWVANKNDDTLTRIDTEDSSTTSYDVSSLGNDPTDIAFDGTNIWISFLTYGVGYFVPAMGSVGLNTDLLGASINNIVFDGTYLWASDQNTGYVFAIATGTGFGHGGPMVTNGLLMYNTSGSLYCIYISGSTLTTSLDLTNCGG